MKLLLAVRLGVRVLLSLLGVAAALGTAVLAGPAGCGRARVRSIGLTDPIRAYQVYRKEYPAPPVAVLPASARHQLMQVRRLLDADTYQVQPAAGGALAVLRLVGVDAPERDQPFGRQATDSVGHLLLGRWAWVQVQGVDQYGRNLAAVRLRAGAFVLPRTVALDSLLAVRGWAWAYAPSGQPVAWASQQQQATAARRGLWKCGITGVVRPGIWRAYNRQDKASAGPGCAW